jgi:hypothetical protein
VSVEAARVVPSTVVSRVTRALDTPTPLGSTTVPAIENRPSAAWADGVSKKEVNSKTKARRIATIVSRISVDPENLLNRKLK